MPSVISEVVQVLAEVKNTTEQAIIQTVEKNFASLIRDDPRLSETYSRLFEGMKHSM